jgi:hypothetical protein
MPLESSDLHSLNQKTMAKNRKVVDRIEYHILRSRADQKPIAILGQDTELLRGKLGFQVDGEGVAVDAEGESGYSILAGFGERLDVLVDQPGRWAVPASESVGGDLVGHDLGASLVGEASAGGVGDWFEWDGLFRCGLLSGCGILLRVC